MCCLCLFFFQAEDGIRDLVRSRGLGDVYKRQRLQWSSAWIIQALRGSGDRTHLDLVVVWLGVVVVVPVVLELVQDLSLIHI